MVITTGGGATKFPTKTRTRAEKQAGTQKLAAYREKVAARAAKKIETPEEYRAKVEAEKAAEIKPTAVIKKVTEAEIQRAAAVPSPVSPAYREQYIAQQQAQLEAQKVTISPHELYGGDVTQPVSISAKAKEELELGAEPTPLKEEIAMAYEGVERFTERQITKGYAEAEVTKPSAWSIAFSERASEIAESIREREKEAPKAAFKPARVLSPLISESAARIVETAGMVPGGISVIRQEPAIIPTAIAAGAGLTVTGLVTSAKEEPAQFISDILVGAGVGYGVGKFSSGVGEFIKFAPKEPVPIETLARPEVVSGKAVFPTAERGTPIPEVLKTFGETVYRYPEPLPKGEYGIHVTGIELPKKLTTIPGKAETPGLYVGPDVSLYFARVTEGMPKIKLFGADIPKAEPSISFVKMRRVERLPQQMRENLALANEFMWGEAPKEVGYTTVKMEVGLKYGARERELVIPPESEFALVESKYYTEYKGTRMLVRRYEPRYETVSETGIKELVNKIKIGKQKIVSAGELSYSYKAPKEYALITPSKLVKSSVGLSLSQAMGYGRYYTPTRYIADSYVSPYAPREYVPESIVTDESVKPYEPDYSKKYFGEEYRKAISTGVSEIYPSYIERSTISDVFKRPPPIKTTVPKKKKEKLYKKPKYIKQQKFTELQNPFRGFRDVFGFGK